MITTNEERLCDFCENDLIKKQSRFCSIPCANKWDHLYGNGLKGFQKGHKCYLKTFQFKKGEPGYWLGKKRPYLWKGSRPDIKGRRFSPKTEFKKGIHYSVNTEYNKEKRKTMVLPIKDSSIERKIQRILNSLKIEFFTHQYMNIQYGYQCDIFIPVQNGINQKTIIECDGDYWHGNLDIFNMNKLDQKRRIQRVLDYERTNQLEEQGFRVIRLWENSIKKLTNDSFQTILMEKNA